MTSRKIVTHCAPTLAGIKTANLFNEHFQDKITLFSEISQFNKLFKDKGIKMIPLSTKNNHALIYVYRSKDLENDFHDKLSQELLTTYGYDSNNVFGSIKKLMSKINLDKEFPHEIGLFLGYPPEDVKGFIDNKALNYTLCGYWKAYGNKELAQARFNKIKTCQKIYLERLNMGYSLKQLVIKKQEED